MIADTIRHTIDRSPALSALNYSKGQILRRLHLRGHRSGATHAAIGVDDSVEYVRRVVTDYLDYGGLGEGGLAGTRILELGPGDNLGVALCLVAKGARSVTCLDRFRPLRDELRNGRIYRRLHETSTAAERRVMDAALRWSADGTVRFDPERIDCRYGVAVEEASSVLPAGSFDVVISRAVLEHVYDLEAAWHGMTRLLAADGRMWHKVDFRNHGFFAGVHPLHFLTLNPALWKLVSSPDPTLNRQRLPSYLRLAAGSFERVEVYVTHVLENDELLPHRARLEAGRDYGQRELALLASIRPRLRSPFREMTDEELLISGIFMDCGRPRRAQGRDGRG